jgi:hypothetical protein
MVYLNTIAEVGNYSSIPQPHPTAVLENSIDPTAIIIIYDDYSLSYRRPEVTDFCENF